jgi:DnaJ-class molecular chaperone
MSDAHDRKQSPSGRTRKPSSSSGEDAEQEPEGEESREPRPCMPCHGSGKVISNLGGHARKIVCPWCRGSGERLTGADAQEFQQEQAALERH